ITTKPMTQIMTTTTLHHRGIRQGAVTLLVAVVALTTINCTQAAEKKKTVEIRAKGSDTLIQLATAWAEAYHKVKPTVVVTPNGAGRATAIAAHKNNTKEISNAPREMKPEEKAKVKEVTEKDVKDFTVAYDALAVYANPANPVKEISIEELREIWAEG